MLTRVDEQNEREKVAAILYPSWCLWKNVFPRYSRLGSRSLKSSHSLDHAMEPNNCCNKNSLHKAGCLMHFWRQKSETLMLTRVDEQNERENNLRASSKYKRTSSVDEQNERENNIRASSKHKRKSSVDEQNERENNIRASSKHKRKSSVDEQNERENNLHESSKHKRKSRVDEQNERENNLRESRKH